MTVRIYQPRIITGEVWHYTVSEPSGWVFRVGYCARGCPGHATAAEATAHWEDWQADESHEHDVRYELRRCEVCGGLTTLTRQYDQGFASAVLCRAHNTIGHLRLVLRTRRAAARRPEQQRA